MGEFCYVDYGKHIGEYLKYKLEQEGRQKTWLARQLNTSKQNLNGNWLNKAEYSPSQLGILEKILGTSFFDEFFENNPDLQLPYHRFKPSPALAGMTGLSASMPEQGSGYRISIEIDPLNFEPAHAEKLGLSLRKALEDFKEAIKGDEK